MGSNGTRLLAAGEAFVDLSRWWKTAVTGSDAFGWLNDLISADISDLQAGQSRRSLLLSPTGHVRGEFSVARTADGLLLIQDSMQPKRIGDLLAPYVLSSDVELSDRTGKLSLFAFPGGVDAPNVGDAEPLRPSCLGSGFDFLLSGEHREQVLGLLRTKFAATDDRDVEDWRVTAGFPRFGIDASEGDLPQESGFAGAVSFGKGCYLGQEAMARVRNLGHPRRVIVHLEGAGTIASGQTLSVAGGEAGRITSASTVGGRTRLLARIAWDAREGPFETSDGIELEVVRPDQTPAA